jgi:hypothetical protein
VPNDSFGLRATSQRKSLLNNDLHGLVEIRRRRLFRLNSDFYSFPADFCRACRSTMSPSEASLAKLDRVGSFQAHIQLLRQHPNMGLEAKTAVTARNSVHLHAAFGEIGPTQPGVTT